MTSRSDTCTVASGWRTSTSLVAHDGVGNPISLPDNARYYVIASAQHGSGTTPSRGICEQLTNPMSQAAFSKALLVAMDAWITQGIAPPPSQYPRDERVHGDEIRPSPRRLTHGRTRRLHAPPRAWIHAWSRLEYVLTVVCHSRR
jgi:hypothetical protein